jgi:hypothetical protein
MASRFVQVPWVLMKDLEAIVTGNVAQWKSDTENEEAFLDRVAQEVRKVLQGPILIPVDSPEGRELSTDGRIKQD